MIRETGPVQTHDRPRIPTATSSVPLNITSIFLFIIISSGPLVMHMWDLDYLKYSHIFI